MSSTTAPGADPAGAPGSGTTRQPPNTRQPTTTGPEEGDEPDPKRWKALAVCLVAGFMTLLDVSIVNVALPSIQQGLGAGENGLQWIVSGYALTFGLLLVPSGRLGDARGRRPAFMLGVALFLLASAACGLAPTALVLILARLVQGIAGGLITPQITGLIQELFRGPERGKAFGWFGTTIGVSTAVGPLLGGAIIAVFGADSGWRYVFFVNLPVGAAALLLARAYIPHSPRSKAPRQDLDPVGVLLLGAAVVCLLLPLIEQQTWRSPARLLLFPLAAALLAGWMVHERRYGRDREPVVNLELFRLRSYTLGAGVGLLYFAGFTGVFFIYTQYLQDGLQYAAWQAGIATTPFALGTALTASLGSRAVMRLGRPLIAGGLVLVLVGLAGSYAAVLAVPGRGAGWAVAAPFLLAGLGSGLVISPNQTLTLSQVPVRRAGSAGGVLQTGQRVGAAAGIAVTGSVFYGAVAGSRGDYAVAYRHGVLAIGSFVLAALALALYDTVSGRRRGTA